MSRLVGWRMEDELYDMVLRTMESKKENATLVM